MRKDRERGAVIVEGIISLTTFMFAIFTILSIVNICYIQARMSNALNTAAKEISQYSYFYYKFGIDQLEAGLSQSEDVKKSRGMADNTVEGIGALMDNLTKANNDLQSGDFDGLVKAIQDSRTNVDGMVDEWADAIAKDPKGLVIGMGKMLGNELAQEGKSLLCEVLAKAFMKKNLKAYPEDDPERFLHAYRVVGGMKGLDFDYTTFLQDGVSNEIQIVMTYDVRVLEFFNLDFDFTFRQCVKATAWGRGISAIHPEDSMPISKPATTIWDSGDTVRGKYIVAAEKAKYEYTDSGHHFDAYDPDTNTFTTIISVDTTTGSDVEARLRAALNDMRNGVEDLEENITVTDSEGNEVTLSSDPDTREYALVIVVPDDANMEEVEAIVKAFEEKYGVEVEIRTGYGNAGAVTPAEPPAEGND